MSTIVYISVIDPKMNHSMEYVTTLGMAVPLQLAMSEPLKELDKSESPGTRERTRPAGHQPNESACEQRLARLSKSTR